MSENRTRFNKFYVPGLFAAASESFKRHSPTWKDYYTVRSTTKAYEESAFMSGLGYLFEKPEGTPFTEDERIQGFSKVWNMKAYAMSLKMTHEQIEDDLYGAMKMGAKDLGISAAASIHLLAVRPLMNATLTTYHTCGDGKAWCVSDHTRLDGSTWSNVMAAATPTTASVEAAVKNFEAIVDHRGKNYDQKARSIVCGPTHRFTMKKILESDLVSENANNNKNVLRGENLTLKIEQEITDGRWFVMGDKNPDTGLIHFDREKPVVQRHGNPDTGDSIFTIYTRFANECNEPRQIYLVPAT